MDKQSLKEFMVEAALGSLLQQTIFLVETSTDEQKDTSVKNAVNAIAGHMETEDITFNDQEKKHLSEIIHEAATKMAKEIKSDESLKDTFTSISDRFDKMNRGIEEQKKRYDERKKSGGMLSNEESRFTQELIMSSDERNGLLREMLEGEKYPKINEAIKNSSVGKMANESMANESTLSKLTRIIKDFCKTIAVGIVSIFREKDPQDRRNAAEYLKKEIGDLVPAVLARAKLEDQSIDRSR